MTEHQMLGLTPGHASHVRMCPRCIESPGDPRGCGTSFTTSSTSMSGERTPIPMLMDNIPRCHCSQYVIRLHDRIANVLEDFMVEAGAIWGRTCVWRFAESGMGPPEIVLGMSRG
jgi:hypothetical protein